MRWSKYLRNYRSDETDFLKNSGKLYFKKKIDFWVKLEKYLVHGIELPLHILFLPR
jgi:hypothetical protein